METQSNQTCVAEFFSPNPWKIVFNVIRVSVAFLYIFWILLIIRMKKLQKCGMVYLHNLAINGLVYALVGIYYSTWSSCYYPSKAICYFSTFLTTYLVYYSGYAIGALILYRLLCCTHFRWASNLSYLTIFVTIALAWIIPIICSLVEIFVLSRGVSFKPKAHLCSHEFYDFYTLITFFSIFGVFVPNGVIVIAYIATLIYLRRIRIKTCNKGKIEPPRITAQIISYIVLYVVTCATNLIATIPLYFPGVIIPLKYLELFFYLVRLLNWIHHILPLGLMYFNADLLQEYKKFFSGKCQKIFK
jgi:hypothetical protein